MTYLHENGATYPYTVSVPAWARATLSTPAGVPTGGYGVTVQAPVALVVERSMYGNTDWSAGTASVASPVTATSWQVAEATVGWFDTYVLILNPGTTATTATVECRLDTGPCQVARVGSQSFSAYRGPVLTSSACQTPRSCVWG